MLPLKPAMTMNFYVSLAKFEHEHRKEICNPERMQNRNRNNLGKQRGINER
jgi:hypothetical protein